MGCAQVTFSRTPPRIRIDLGNVTSSDDDYTPVSTPSPKPPFVLTSTLDREANFLKYKLNAMHCYFCNSNEGLLIRMITCNCRFFGHEECFRKWINAHNYRCSVCKQRFYNTSKHVPTLWKGLSLDTLQMSKRTAVVRYKTIFLLNRYHNNKKERDECYLSSDDLSDSDIIELDT